MVARWVAVTGYRPAYGKRIRYMGIPYGTANGRPLLFLSRDFNHSWLTTLAGQTDHQKRREPLYFNPN